MELRIKIFKFGGYILWKLLVGTVMVSLGKNLKK